MGVLRDKVQQLYKDMSAITGYSATWQALVADIQSIKEEKDYKSVLDDMNLQHSLDDLAIKTAWMYEQLGDKKRARAIFQALGYEHRARE